MRQSDIEQIASQWVILQEVDASDKQIAELNRWLDADPRNRVTFLRIREAWRRARRLRAMRSLDGEVNVHLLQPEAPQATITVPPSSARRGWRWAVAAAITGVCLLVPLLWMSRQSYEIQTYVTAIGGHRRVQLADGTTIELNTNTVLRTRISPERRDVYLDRGEAFFKVTHVANSPFTVVAGHSVIHDIGTAFDVRLLDARRPDDVDILVLEGHVIVYKGPSGFASTLTRWGSRFYRVRHLACRLDRSRSGGAQTGVENGLALS